MNRTPLALIVAAALLAGCPATNTPVTPASTKPPTSKPNTPNLVPKTSVSGSAVAPATMVAAGGGNILSHNGGVMVAAGGGNMVAAGGGNLVAAGGGNAVPTGAGRRRLLATAQKPLAGTTVYVTDGEGKLLEGVAPVETDAQGKFKLEGVPKEGTYLVHVRANSADGKPTTLVTMVQPAEGKPAEVSTETTCVAVALFGEGGSKKLAAMNLTAFQAAVAAMAPLVAGRDAPDLTDRAAIRGWMDKLSGEVAALKLAMDGMSAQLGAIQGQLGDLRADVKAGFDDLKNQLGGLINKTPEPTPAPTATPAAPASPAATPTPIPGGTYRTKAPWALRAAIAEGPDSKNRRFLIAPRPGTGDDKPGYDDDGSPGGGIQIQLAAKPADGAIYDVYAALDKSGMDPFSIKNAASLIGDIQVRAGQGAFTPNGATVSLSQVFLAPFFKVMPDFVDDRLLTWKGAGAAPAGPVTLKFLCERSNPNWSSDNPDFEKVVPEGANGVVKFVWAAIELPARYTVTATTAAGTVTAGQMRVYTRHYNTEVDVSFDLNPAGKSWDLDGL